MRSFNARKNAAGAADHGDPVSPRVLSDVIGAIYDCTLDPSRWEGALLDITHVMSAESAILSLNDLRHDRLLVDKSVGWGEFGIDERQKHIPEIHAGDRMVC